MDLVSVGLTLGQLEPWLAPFLQRRIGIRNVKTRQLVVVGNIRLEAAPLVARPGIDADGGAGEVGRDPNDRHLDPYCRSTLVDSATLHTTCLRYQAAHREVETGVAEPAATAPQRKQRVTKSRSRPSRSWAVCGGDLSITLTDSKALN